MAVKGWLALAPTAVVTVLPAVVAAAVKAPDLVGGPWKWSVGADHSILDRQYSKQ